MTNWTIENAVGVACDAIEKQLQKEKPKFEGRRQKV
jgi:ribosome-associated translation inhibitor RaiA